jgi:hypothetical protein
MVKIVSEYCNANTPRKFLSGASLKFEVVTFPALRLDTEASPLPRLCEIKSCRGLEARALGSHHSNRPTHLEIRFLSRGRTGAPKIKLFHIYIPGVSNLTRPRTWRTPLQPSP